MSDSRTVNVIWNAPLLSMGTVAEVGSAIGKTVARAEKVFAPLLTFELAGEPLSWKRTNTWHGKRLTPKAQRQYQRAIGYACLAARPVGWDLDGRYAVELTAYVSRRGQDIDNLAKNVLDALNGVAWRDDMRVDELRIARVLERERPRVVVAIRRVE